MSAAATGQPTGAATRSNIPDRLALALWLSMSALSLVLLALTIAFHLSTRYEWYFAGAFDPWRMLTVDALGVIGAPILGALIVWQQPGNLYGWVWCVFGLVSALRAAALAYVLWAVYLAGPYQPGLFEAAWVGMLMDPLSIGLIPLLLLLFPDGRPASPRWRPVVWAVLIVCAAWTLATAVAPGWYGSDRVIPNPIDWLSGTPSEVARVLAAELRWPSLLLIAVGALSLLVRYRRARNRERQQIKWLAWVAVPLLASFILLTIRPWSVFSVFRVAVVDAFESTVIWTIAVSAVYVAIGIAVLRHHLYDIDRLINRTVVYGLLSVGLVGAYVAIVSALGALLRQRAQLPIALVATGLVAVAFQPLRERLQRGVDRLLYGQRRDPYGVLAGLGRQLDATLAPAAVLPAVVRTLAQALKLPYVAVELGDGQDGQADGAVAPVASTGHPVDDPLVLPLVYQQQPVGRLLLGPRAPGEAFTAAERRLLDDLARQVGVAAHAVRLTADLQRSRERLVSAREEERRRLRRDLHDGLGPALAGVAMQLGAAQALLDHDPATVRMLLGTLQDQLRAAIADIRRLVYDLRPPALDELGLAGALREQATRFTTELTAAADGGPPAVRVEAPERLPGLPAAVEVAAYRIATEALTNVARHANARVCTLRLTCNGALEVEVRDDGSGLPDRPRAGVGLGSMRERAAELGGTCTVQALAGGGTLVRARLPLPDG
jgi:two-component system NarL family sensor kinase